MDKTKRIQQWEAFLHALTYTPAFENASVEAHNAIVGLVEQREPMFIEWLVQTAREHPDSGIRSMAFLCLPMDDDAARAFIIKEALESPRNEQRDMALDKLYTETNIGDDHTPQVVGDMLQALKTIAFNDGHVYPEHEQLLALYALEILLTNPEPGVLENHKKMVQEVLLKSIDSLDWLEVDEMLGRERLSLDIKDGLKHLVLSNPEWLKEAIQSEHGDVPEFCQHLLEFMASVIEMPMTRTRMRLNESALESRRELQVFMKRTRADRKALEKEFGAPYEKLDANQKEQFDQRFNEQFALRRGESAENRRTARKLMKRRAGGAGPDKNQKGPKPGPPLLN